MKSKTKKVTKAIVSILIGIAALFISIVMFGGAILFFLFFGVILFRSIYALKTKRVISFLNGSAELSFIILDLVWTLFSIILFFLVKINSLDFIVLFSYELIGLIGWLIAHEIRENVINRNKIKKDKDTMSNFSLFFILAIYSIGFIIKFYPASYINPPQFFAMFVFFMYFSIYNGLKAIQKKRGYIRFVYEIKGRDAVIIGVLWIILWTILFLAI